MSQLTITIQLDNAAFGDPSDSSSDQLAAEVSRILFEYSEWIKTKSRSKLNMSISSLYDINGNKVGVAEFDNLLE